MNKPLSRRWKIALAAALILGTILRLVWASDIEWKFDEQWMFTRAIAAGITEPWPLLGVASGVHVKNPGMSVWTFIGLARLSGAQTPPELTRAVELLNVFALALLAWFAVRWTRDEEREPWLWAVLLASVNPISIMYHRKIWAQSVLPAFSMLFLMAWWKRDRKIGAFFWGLIGACIGQIHMSGFFFAAGFALWALLFDRKTAEKDTGERKGTCWSAWFLGSLIGVIPMIPWLAYLVENRGGGGGHSIFFGWEQAVQLRFWVFWITGSMGLHLGNALGVHEGNGILLQNQDFFRSPLVWGRPTYLILVAHVGLVLSSAWILLRGLIRMLWHGDIFRRGLRNVFSGHDASGFAIRSAFLGYGIVLTLSTLLIHRYYLLIVFPLEFLWLARIALSPGAGLKTSKRALTMVLVFQTIVTFGFLHYIRVNGGSPRGDFGVSYRQQLESR